MYTTIGFILLVSLVLAFTGIFAFQHFVLPRSQQAQNDIVDRIWSRSEASILRLERHQEQADRRANRQSRRITHLERQVESLIRQLRDAGIEPDILPYEPKEDGAATNITVNAGIDIDGDVTGRDKREGGVDFHSGMS